MIRNNDRMPRADEQQTTEQQPATTPSFVHSSLLGNARAETRNHTVDRLTDPRTWRWCQGARCTRHFFFKCNEHEDLRHSCHKAFICLWRSSINQAILETIAYHIKHWSGPDLVYCNEKMTITPHKLGVHKILKYIPLNAIFDAPSKARLRKAVNIADLRLCAKARAHKVCLS